MPVDCVGSLASSLERVLTQLSAETWEALSCETVEPAPDGSAIRVRPSQNGPWLELAIATEALPRLAELKLSLIEWITAALAPIQSVATVENVNVSSEPYRWFRFTSASQTFLLGLREIASSRPPAGALDELEVEVEICFGTTRMKLEEIAALSPDRVITLDQHVDEPVDLLVNNRLFAKGVVVLMDNCLGFEVTQICH